MYSKLPAKIIVSDAQVRTNGNTAREAAASPLLQALVARYLKPAQADTTSRMGQDPSADKR